MPLRRPIAVTRMAACLSLCLSAALLGGCGRPVLRGRDLVDAPPSGGMPLDQAGEAPPPVQIVGYVPRLQTPTAVTPRAAGPGAPAQPVQATPAGPMPTGNPNAPPPPHGPEISAALSKAVAGDSTFTLPADNAALADGKLHIELAGSGTYLVAIDGSHTFIMASGTSKDVTDLKPGPHVLRAVQCDANGAASFDAPLSVRQFTIGPTPQKLAGFELKAPILTVGRPLGTAKPDEATAIPFDIRIDGVQLSESGLQLYYKIDNGDDTVQTTYPPDKKQPIRLFGLDPGPHKLTVWLQDSNTKRPVDNAGLGRVERQFTVTP